MRAPTNLCGELLSWLMGGPRYGPVDTDTESDDGSEYGDTMYYVNHMWCSDANPGNVRTLAVCDDVFQHIGGYTKHMYELDLRQLHIHATMHHDDAEEIITLPANHLPASHLKTVSWREIADWVLQVEEGRYPNSYTVTKIVVEKDTEKPIEPDNMTDAEVNTEVVTEVEDVTQHEITQLSLRACWVEASE